MAQTNRGGSTALERLLRRYETTDKRCTECGHVDEEGNWRSKTNGRQVVYHHTCPVCGADREHVFSIRR